MNVALRMRVHGGLMDFEDVADVREEGLHGGFGLELPKEDMEPAFMECMDA